MPLDQQPAVVELPIETIRVEGRFRRELGDIASFAASIAEIGLLHPVVVMPDYRLIAGERRLHAMRKLGHTHVPVRVVPINDIVRGEFAENINRKDSTPSEMVAIGRAVEPLLRAEAKERKREGGRSGGKASGKLPEASNGDARDHVARYSGISGKTYEKAKEVVVAAEREPDRYGALVERMDRTRKVDGVWIGDDDAVGSAQRRRVPADGGSLLGNDQPPGRTRSARATHRKRASVRTRP